MRRTWQDNLLILANVARGATIASEARRLGVSNTRAWGMMHHARRQLAIFHPELQDADSPAEISQHMELITSYLGKPKPLRHGEDSLPESVSTMTRNVLLSRGFRTKSDVISAIKDGRLSANAGSKAKAWGLGPKGFKDLCAALGVELPEAETKKASPATLERAVKMLERYGYKVTPPKKTV